MFGIGFGELLFIAIIALIFIGPKQLPDLARSLGKMLNEFKRASEDLTGEFFEARDNFRREVKDVTQTVKDVTQTAKNAVTMPIATEQSKSQPQANSSKDRLKRDIEKTLQPPGVS